VLESIDGERLGSVTFMSDYMAVAFDHGTAITIFSWPALINEGEIVQAGTPLYAELLRLLVGRTVSRTTKTDDYFEIGFDNGVVLQVRLDDDGVGGEHAMINRAGSPTIIV
jgi:hypothetical protein